MSTNTNSIRSPRFVNLRAPSAAPFWHAMAGWLGERTRRPLTIETEGHWVTQRDLLASGEVSLGAVCGSVYVGWADQREPLAALVAAPVMAAPRYEGRPVYFSELVVKADSPFEVFEDLMETRWAYSLEDSFAGHLVIRPEIARRGWGPGFVRSLVRSGSYEASLALVAAGAVDVAPVDSIVLEGIFRAQPERARAFRVLESWGPLPIPPVVASTQVSPAWRARWREALCDMHEDDEGRRIMAAAGVAAFVPVEDADYAPIRAMMAGQGRR